ncbi:MAG: hypothetical protein JO112_19130 [Planctomycetes bacterium]|nr:hypothetical protein [Planctomycetota bacterium]
MMSWIRLGLVAVLASLVLGGTVANAAAQRRVGGPSTYAHYPGTATIVRVEMVPASEESSGQAKDAYAVWFTFQPQGEVKEALGREHLARHPEHEFRLTNGWHPGPQFLKKYGIEKGKKFEATLLVITRGTSTPVLLRLNGVDPSDYFEAAPNAQGR